MTIKVSRLCLYLCIISFNLCCVSLQGVPELVVIKINHDSVSNKYYCTSEPLVINVGGSFQVRIEDLSNNTHNPRCQRAPESFEYDKLNILDPYVYESNAVLANQSGEFNYKCVYYTKYPYCNKYVGRTCHVMLSESLHVVDPGEECVVDLRVQGNSEPKQLKFNIIREGSSKFKCIEEPLDIEIGDKFKVYVNNGDHAVQTSNTCATSLTGSLPTKITFSKISSGGFVSNMYYFAKDLGAFNFTCTFNQHSCLSTGKNGECYYLDPGRNYERKSEAVRCFADGIVHKRGENVEKPKGYLTVNVANYSSAIVRNEYQYNNGQGAHFTCHKTSGSFVKLVYRRHNVVDTEYQERDSVSMYVKLRDATHDATLECITADKIDKRKHVIKLILKKNTKKQQGLAFVVNGFYVPITKQNGVDKFFEYKFYDGEQIFGALVTNSSYGTPTCTLASKIIPESRFDFKISENQSRTFITCTVPLINNSPEHHHVELTFVLYKPEFNPYITGLAMSNILMQYSNKARNQIQYGMRSQDSLTVTCKSFDSQKKTSWIPSDSLIAPQYTELIIKSTKMIQTRECRVDNIDKPTILKIITTDAVVAIPRQSVYPVTEVPQDTTTRQTIATTEAPKLPDSSPTEEITTPTPTDGLGTDRKGKSFKYLKPNVTTPRPKRTGASTQRTTKQSVKAAVTAKNSFRAKKPVATSAISTTTSSITLSTDKYSLASETSTAAPDHSITQTLGPPEPQGFSPTAKGTIIVVAGCLLFVIVLGVFVICVIFKKRKQIKTNPSNMEYQNLPAHNEGPMATPPQWDHINPYIETSSVDNLYAKPIPKCKRNPQPTYAVPRDSTYFNNLPIVDYNEPTYSSVQGANQTYASVKGTAQSYEPEETYEPGTAYQNFGTNERQTYQNLSTRKKAQPKKSHQNLSTDEPHTTYQNISTRDKPQAYKTQPKIDHKHAKTNEPTTPFQNHDATKTKKASLKKTNKQIGSPSNENEYQNQTELLNNESYINVGDSKYVNANVGHVEPDYCQLINK